MAIFDRPSHDPLPEGPDFDDVKYAAAKGLLSLVPGLGELFSLVVASPLEQRRNDWLWDLELRLRELGEQVRGFQFERLGENEAFVSATMRATQAALQTHDKEKLDALRNTILNVSAGTAPTADKQAIFFQLVDRFSVLHLRLLTFAEDPKKFGARWVNHERGSTSIYEVIYKVFPDLAGHFQLVNAVIVDLNGSGLIAPAIAGAMSPTSTYKKWATFHGEEFLRFIQAPDLPSSQKQTSQ
jgi:hypothetical protein